MTSLHYANPIYKLTSLNIPKIPKPTPLETHQPNNFPITFNLKGKNTRLKEWLIDRKSQKINLNNLGRALQKISQSLPTKQPKSPKLNKFLIKTD